MKKLVLGILLVLFLGASFANAKVIMTINGHQFDAYHVLKETSFSVKVSVFNQDGMSVNKGIQVIGDFNGGKIEDSVLNTDDLGQVVFNLTSGEEETANAFFTVSTSEDKQNLPIIIMRKAEKNVYYTFDKVGIGVPSPTQSLHVSGSIGASKFYDTDSVSDTYNDACYLDPTGTSVLNRLRITSIFNRKSAFEVGYEVWLPYGINFSTGDAFLGDVRAKHQMITPIITSELYLAPTRWGVPYIVNLETGDTVLGSIKANTFLYNLDESLMKNPLPLEGSLDKITQLEGISFEWKDDEKGEINLGLIAQDVEKVYPELVSTDEETGLKSVEYANLIAPLIEAIKEQQQQIDELKSELENLKK